MIFSWHDEVWQQLFRLPDRLPHALLLAGPEGGGKEIFARAFAARLLCERSVGSAAACGGCPACGWFAAGNHPDFRLVEVGGDGETGEDPEAGNEAPVSKKRSTQIRIDQIRDLEDFLNVGTHRHGARIVLINPAEAMNAATANALLKMLEEPSSSTLFLLISHNPRRLLPTVRSRCQTLVLARPEREEAVAWLSEAKVANPARALAHAGGMPLAASREAIDNERLVTFLRDLGEIAQTGPAAVAGQWEAWLKDSKDGSRPMDKHTLIVWLQKWLFDLVAVKLAGRPIYHPAHDPELRTLASRASARGLIDCYNELLRIRAVARHPLNPRLFLEDMLSRYARAVAGRN